MFRLSLCLPLLIGGLAAAEPAEPADTVPPVEPPAALDELPPGCAAGRGGRQGFGRGRCGQQGFAQDRQQRRAQRRAQRFGQLDVDGSGGVSLAEFLAAAPPAQWRGRGRCRTGAVDGGRWARHQAQLRQVFPSVDADASGELEQAEFAELPAAMRQARFAGLDADGDGQLSRAEFLAGAPQPGPAAASASGRGPGAGRGRRPDPQRIFGFIDSDDDGQISAAEWAAHRRPGRRGHGRGGRCPRSPAGDG